jgi:quinol-cytochrome oxidoreductase complex cytochrome b subunit
MTMPHLVVRELIAFLALSLFLVVLALVANAPLEEIADPSRTPNPAKAPWYFLGLQELLHYYPPLVSGVLLPGLLIVALVVIPYMRVNLERAPLARARGGRALVRVWIVVGALSVVSYFTGAAPVWPFIGTLIVVGAGMSIGIASRSPGRVATWLRARSLAFWIFSWFLLTATVLTVIGVFFRGPGWSFTLPWRDGIYY